MGGGGSKQPIIIQQEDPRVKEWEYKYRELQKSEDRLTRQQRDEMQERKEIREQNDRMIHTVLDRMRENEKYHDEEMAKAREEFIQKRAKIYEEQSQNAEKSEAEHKAQLMKLEVEYNSTKVMLEGKIAKSKLEGEGKIKNLEEENEKIRKKRFEEVDGLREGIRKQQMECQKEIKQLREHQNNLRNQMFEEHRAQKQLEYQQELELASQLHEDLKKQIAYDATVTMLKEYLKILDTVETTGERLREIEVLCIGDITEDFKCDADFYLKEVSKSKNDFKNQVRKFQQLAINNSNAHQEVIQLCKNYLHNFENLVDGVNFMSVCVHLPSAVKNNNEKKIRMLGEKAGTAYTEFLNTRLEITGKLNAIAAEDQNQQQQKMQMIED